jgi:hypothetical protein
MLKFLGWVVLLIAVSGCDKQETIANGCFKGKLVIKGICKNDVVQLVEGKSDALLVESSWTYPTTGTVYRNVFAVDSKCTFPDYLKEGDEFYFTIDPGQMEDCALCKALSPVPDTKLKIKICVPGS